MVDARHNHRLFLHLPCGVTRHLKTVINRFEMAHPLGKAIVETSSTKKRGLRSFPIWKGGAPRMSPPTVWVGFSSVGRGGDAIVAELMISNRFALDDIPPAADYIHPYGVITYAALPRFHPRLRRDCVAKLRFATHGWVLNEKGHAKSACPFSVSSLYFTEVFSRR